MYVFLLNFKKQKNEKNTFFSIGTFWYHLFCVV